MENKTSFKKITYPGVPENKYLISEKGDVFSTFLNRCLKPDTDKDGYFKVYLGGKHYIVHRLVAWEFYPKTRDLKLCVDHIDGNKQNNYYKNLEWVTIKENTRRAEAMGLRNVRGEANGHTKYSEELVHDICKLLEEGYNEIEVWRKINDTNRPLKTRDDYSLYHLIYRLKKGTIWPDVIKLYKIDKDANHKSKCNFIPNQNSRFTEEQIHYICKSALEEKTPYEILKSMGIDKTNKDFKRYAGAIHSILRGTNWRIISDQYFDFDNMNKKHPTKYDIDNAVIYSSIDMGMDFKSIIKMYGINKKQDDPNLYRALRRRYHNYTVMKKLKNEDVVEIYDMDDENTWTIIQ
jgi:hypothetical protein